MNHDRISPRTLPRRRWLQETSCAASLAAGAVLLPGCAPNVLSGGGAYSAGTFSVVVTPPLGHALMGGGIAPAQSVADPLHARGWVLLGPGGPWVFVSVEWCEIRNEAFERWRTQLALAAGTERSKVLVSAVHVHDAPVADLLAERILREAGAPAAASVCHPEFHERCVSEVAGAVRTACKKARRVTHVAYTEAEVENIASNRRYLLPDGRPAYDRMSANRNVLARDGETGTIDPKLRCISFWNGDEAIAALHVYATHPMSHYGKGAVSADFVGLARARLQADSTAGLHIYASGCSGNVTAGKWNDGAPENRSRLADRLFRAMNQSWARAFYARERLRNVGFKSVPLLLEPRKSPGFAKAELEAKLRNPARPFDACLAAMGLSWLDRLIGQPEIDVPALDFGVARLLLLPAESYVEYQLFAQSVSSRPVVTAGYGECAPGYIPIERAWQEKDSNLGDWCWVAPGSQERLESVIRETLA